MAASTGPGPVRTSGRLVVLTDDGLIDLGKSSLTVEW